MMKHRHLGMVHINCSIDLLLSEKRSAGEHHRDHRLFIGFQLRPHEVLFSDFQLPHTVKSDVYDASNPLGELRRG